MDDPQPGLSEPEQGGRLAVCRCEFQEFTQLHSRSDLISERGIQEIQHQEFSSAWRALSCKQIVCSCYLRGCSSKRSGARLDFFKAYDSLRPTVLKHPERDLFQTSDRRAVCMSHYH